MKTKKEELWDVPQQLRQGVIQETRNYSLMRESCLLAKGNQENTGMSRVE